jgi:hypothetical protein
MTFLESVSTCSNGLIGLQLKVSGKNITGYSLFYEKVAGAIYKSFHLF